MCVRRAFTPPLFELDRFFLGVGFFSDVHLLHVAGVHDPPIGVHLWRSSAKVRRERNYGTSPFVLNLSVLCDSCCEHERSSKLVQCETVDGSVHVSESRRFKVKRSVDAQ